MIDNRKRSLAKTVSWRVVGFLFTTWIVYLFNKDIKQAFTIMGTADAIKIFIYYAHERIWNRIKFGRTKHPDYQI